MNILVTGGGGYIGSVTTRLLIESGHTVTVLDNFKSGHRDAVPADVRIIEGNVGDFSQLTSYETFDAVIHLAALISVQESMQKPELYWQNNVVETLALLDGMRERGIKQIIFASTAAVYGNPEATPITEIMPKNPTSTYGMTKLAVDMALTSEAAAHGLAATSVRFFNVAGSYQDAYERHPAESHLIPLAFDAATGKRNHLSLFGTDYDTPDGTCIRDYIHVADLARAMIAALTHNTPGEHHIYNLGNGTGFSNRELLATVEQVTGLSVPIIEADRREGDPAILVASSENARREIDWVPERPQLEDIIRDAWHSYQAAN